MKKQKRSIELHDVFGWYGAVALVSGYFLVSFDVIEADQLIYQLINLTAAAGLLYLGYKKHVKESMFLNAFWVAIALFAILKLLTR